MSSTNMSYYAILRYYVLTVKSASRMTVRSDGLNVLGVRPRIG
jgi:hypothetical protein